MLEQHIGETPFRDGIRHYLQKHQYSNTETSDLWDAIEEATGDPVRRIMNSWIFQRGFPLLSITGDEMGKLTLSQQRFSFTPLNDGDDSLWSIPVTLRYGHDGQVVERQELLESASLDVHFGNTVDWVVANAGGHGFYRVRYAPNLLRQLQAVMLQQLSAIERYGLVDDAWESMVAGSPTAADFLALARELQDEDDLDVWRLLCDRLEQLGRLLDGEAEACYQAVLFDLYAPALERLGWMPGPDDTSRVRELRGLIIRSLAVQANDAGTQAQCRELHAKYLEDSSSVEPNIAAAVATAVAFFGGEEDYRLFVQRFKNATAPQEEQRYRTLLASFPDANYMAETLAMCVGGTVRTQDAPHLVAQCLRNQHCGEQAWRFVQDNWHAMLEKYPDNAIVRMLDGVKTLSQPEVAANVEAFFDSHEVPHGEKTLKQVLERLRVNVALREREAEPFAAALAG